MIVNANSDRRNYIEIYFNGKKSGDCIYADDVAGWYG